MMTDGFKKELQKFDLERVIPAWDGLISKQQATLSQQNVPTMFVTKTVADREVCDLLSSKTPLLNSELKYSISYGHLSASTA